MLFFLCACTEISRNCLHMAERALAAGPRRFMRASAGQEEPAADMPDMPVAAKPERLQWKDLNGIRYEKKWSDKYQQSMLFPAFTPSLLRMKGKEYFISGYIIPLDTDNGLYALSRTTYSSCYFCGQGGPETIISLKFRNKPRRPYVTDQLCTVSGTLDLNNVDDEEFILIFRNTEEYKP